MSSPTKNEIKRKDEESLELVESESEVPSNVPIFTQNFLTQCFNDSNYCLSLMDYLKKLYHFSQIDFYSAYVQLIYCFKPQEINDMARIRKRKFNI